MANAPSLKISQRVDIIFESKMLQKDVSVLKAVVYDYKGKEIILSQTSPALKKEFLNREMMITFLMNKEGRQLRFGISARLIRIIDNYQLAATNTVAAVILEQQGVPKQLDFRMYFRVKPSLNSAIALIYKEKKVNLIDISLGGAKFTSPRDDLFPSGHKIKFRLLIGGKVFNVDATVCGVSIPDAAAANKNIQYVRVEFDYDNKQLDIALGKAIIDTERQLLSEGKI